jgi:UDP-N-acetylglucosamine enolpyruvyl transferase
LEEPLTHRDVIEDLMEMLRSERAENVRLTNIILQHLGVSVVEGDTTVRIQSAGNSNDKVRVSPESWPSYRARLEKRFRNRIEELEPEVLDFKQKEEQHAETDQ